MLLSQSSSDIQPFHGYVDTTEDALRLIEVRIRFQRRTWLEPLNIRRTIEGCPSRRLATGYTASQRARAEIYDSERRCVRIQRRGEWYQEVDRRVSVVPVQDLWKLPG